MIRRCLVLLLLIAATSACSPRAVTTTPQIGGAPAILVTQTPTSELTSTAIPTSAPASPIPNTPPTLPPDPFRGLRIEDLAARTYGGPGIQLGDEVEGGEGFRRWEMSYISDGLRITGLVDYPLGRGLSR